MMRDWIDAGLEDLAVVVQGQSPPGSTYNAVGKGMPFLQGKAEFGSLHPLPTKWCTAPVRLAEAGDILMSIRAPVGPTNVADQPYCIGRGLAAIRASCALDRQYLLHYLRHSVSRLVDRATGTTFDAIGGETLRSHRVKLAPISEQRRIAEALDSCLSRLDAAERSLEQAQAKLKAYRASVLKSAVEGRLVPTEAELARQENRSYEPAQVLLDRILKERRRRWEEAELARLKKAGKTPKDDKWKAKYKEPVTPDPDGLPALPDGWCWATVDSFLLSIEAGKNFLCEGRPPRDGEVGVVKVSAVTWGTFDELESKTCHRPELIDDRSFIQSGDFLFSRANTLELVGACVVVAGVTRTLMLSDKILRLRLIGAVDRWLLWCLRSSWGRNEIEAQATGNQLSMRNIGQGGIRKLRVPLPPRGELDRLVDEIETCISMAAHTNEQVKTGQGRSSRLRQAILKWAFEGRLVDQDPNDEPAEELLARVRAERATAPKPGRTGRRRHPSQGAVG